MVAKQLHTKLGKLRGKEREAGVSTTWLTMKKNRKLRAKV